MSGNIGGVQIFPNNHIINQNIAGLPVHANNANYLATLGTGTALSYYFYSTGSGLPYDVVNSSTPDVAITYMLYGSESDPGPFPIPPTAHVEPGSDHHVLVLDTSRSRLYELSNGVKQGDNSWHADSGATWDLTSNALRPAGWTSADAAGLFILPLLIRYDEALSGSITHALRLVIPVAQNQNTHIWPARHHDGTNANVNFPMEGLRLRLKASTNISGFSAINQAILTALKQYGAFIADQGSSAPELTGAPDSRWNFTDTEALRTLHVSDFEVVDESGLMVNVDSAGVSTDGYTNYKTIIEPNLVAALSVKNLLNYVKLIGPETTMQNDGWLTQASTDLANTLSGYIRHAFPSGAADISSGSREAVTRTLVAGILSSDPGAFVMQGEMGSGFYGPGAQVAGYQYGIEMTDYAVQLARAGMSALIAYILDDDMWGTTWGMQKITGGGAGAAPVPLAAPRALGGTLVGLTYLEAFIQSGALRPWFFPWSLLCNSILEGSTIYAPAPPSTNDLRVLAAQAPQGAWTFVLVNRAASRRQIRVSVPFAPVSTQTLQQYVYSEAAPLYVDGNGFPLPTGSVQAVLARGFTVPMAGNSVLILTQASAAQTTIYNVKRPPLQKRR